MNTYLKNCFQFYGVIRTYKLKSSTVNDNLMHDYIEKVIELIKKSQPNSLLHPAFITVPPNRRDSETNIM